jgi:hypothetical protein
MTAVIRGRKFLSILCMSTVLLLSGSGWMPAEAHPLSAPLECPATVDSGTSFLCTVQVEQDATEVFMTWSGMEIAPVLRPVSGMLRAEMLLGAGLSMGGTEQTVQLRFDRGAAEEKISRNVKVIEREYPEQRLTLPAHMAQPPSEVLSRIQGESTLARSVLSGITPANFWTLPLHRPLDSDVISPFGVRRIINGEPRSQHRGVDLRGAEGVLVGAAAAGIVTLIDDHYFAGTSVYVDHGSGVYSVYFHLSEPLVVKDQVIRRGEPVGKVGRTGRVTGPHLHFGLYILGEAVDPMPLFSISGPDRG